MGEMNMDRYYLLQIAQLIMLVAIYIVMVVKKR